MQDCLDDQIEFKASSGGQYLCLFSKEHHFSVRFLILVSLNATIQSGFLSEERFKEDVESVSRKGIELNHNSITSTQVSKEEIEPTIQV